MLTMILCLLLHFITALTTAAPPPASPHALHAAAVGVPTCFPTRPHCIRPRVDECRDAIWIMSRADPGYPVLLGRPDTLPTRHHPHSFDVPRVWTSLPYNCIVKLDVTDPEATEEVRLKALTVQAEQVLRKCVMGETGCGGSVLIGKRRELKMTLAYYTSVELEGEGEGKGVVAVDEANLLEANRSGGVDV